MATLNLDDLDKHIANLQAQLTSLAETLDATEPNDPEWLATDLITLKGSTNMLVDNMRRFRKRAVNEGLGVRAKKKSNNRLSIEGAKPSSAANGSDSPNGSKEHHSSQLTPPTKTPKASPPNSSTPAPNPGPEPGSTDAYEVQYVDVTEEVNRRLRESRLRQLMDSPSTAQKRKFDAYGDGRGDDGGGEETEGILGEGRSPVKRLRSVGQFEGVVTAKEGLKRTGENEGGEGDGREDEREDVKRRKI